MNANLLEKCQVKALVAPGTDMNTAAITGARVGLKNYDRVAVLIDMGTSTGAVVEFTLRQHTAASGGTSKAVAVSNPYYKKVGSADVWTKVEQTSANSVYTLSTDFAGAAGMVCFEILAEDLDVDGGFAFFSVDAADSTAAKLIAAYYVLGSARYAPAYAVATV